MKHCPVFLALDLGTTTLAGRLLDQQGRILAEGKVLNPQRAFGADVIRRLEAALAGSGGELRRLLLAGSAALVTELLDAADCSREQVAKVAIAANPAMTVLLCGDDPRPLLFPPHRPHDRRIRQIALPELALPPATVFPLVSGYVGGDLVACLYGFDSLPGTTLCIDLGTNGELALGSTAGWLATSVAAGPAFEGGEMACGMLATVGAIHNVTLAEGRLRCEVIGGGPPLGLAGSGLWAAIAAGINGGLIDHSGRILAAEEVDSDLSRYLVENAGGVALRLYRDATREIFISQSDVRAFQLAKGAIRAGVECLLARAGLLPEGLDRVIVTGAFGLSLGRETLKSVAILPPVMVEKTLFVPGGALAGVSRFLLDAEDSERLCALTETVRSYPLSGTPAFERAFLSALDF